MRHPSREAHGEIEDEVAGRLLPGLNVLIGMAPKAQRAAVSEMLLEVSGALLGLMRRAERAESEIAAIKSAPRPVYRGVWRAKTMYATASIVTYDGSMWRADQPTESRPGSDDSWQLCVKRGRDAR